MHVYSTRSLARSIPKLSWDSTDLCYARSGIVSQSSFNYDTDHERVWRSLGDWPCVLETFILGSKMRTHASLASLHMAWVRILDPSIKGQKKALWGSQGVLSMRAGVHQSIGSIVSDAIVRSWLWSTVTRSSALGYDTTFCGSRFSTGRQMAIEDFTFFRPHATLVSDDHNSICTQLFVCT